MKNSPQRIKTYPKKMFNKMKFPELKNKTIESENSINRVVARGEGSWERKEIGE